MSSPFPAGRHIWPEYEPGETATVFSPRPPLRKLIVVVDEESSVAQAPSRSPAHEVLAGLIAHRFVEVFRIADAGPPAELIRLSEEVGTEYVPGWILFGKRREKTDGLPLVQATEDGKRIIRGSLIGNAYELARDDVGSEAYPGLAPDAAAARRVADVRVLEAAIEIDADLLITERPYLLDLSRDFARRVVWAPPESALPLVGLYLRRQGVFDTYRSIDGNAAMTLNRGLYYWVATRDLLPAAWRWASACVGADDSDGRLGHLAQSALRRVDRALQERDEVLWALNQPQDNDIAGDALDALDGVILGLMGALDVTARVAHRVLGLGDREFQAGWQKRDWLKKVRATAPGLAALVAPDSPGADTVDIVRLLRNSIHGEALLPLGVGTGSGQRDVTLVGLPPDDATRLLAAMDALGGRGLFGVRELLPGRVHADPGDLVDEVFRRTVDLLDRLMAETPVETVATGPLPGSADGPPEDHIFGTRSRESIRLQIGLRAALPSDLRPCRTETR
ncbi:MAG: hypothetical protein JST08_01195 [Actinobacteria bacterium]|nr:hypothetical protein [Actinomycetota bacterium]